MEEKSCTKCKQIFFVTSEYFTFDKRNKNGLQAECKQCHNKRTREYTKKNKNKVKENKKEYYKNNLDKIKESQKKYQEKNKDKILNYHATPRYRFNTYHHSAKARNIFWDLSFEEFIEFWQKPCTYCNDNINTIGLDRIDNELGYEKDNIVSCCEMCNRMKMKYTFEEFTNQCKKVTKNFSFLLLINKKNGQRVSTKTND